MDAFIDDQILQVADNYEVEMQAQKENRLRTAMYKIYPFLKNKMYGIKFRDISRDLGTFCAGTYVFMFYAWTSVNDDDKIYRIDIVIMKKAPVKWYRGKCSRVATDQEDLLQLLKTDILACRNSSNPNIIQPFSMEDVVQSVNAMKKELSIDTELLVAGGM